MQLKLGKKQEEENIDCFEELKEIEKKLNDF